MQHVRLTPRGRALVERSVLALLEGERDVLGVLSGAERAMLVELLHKVALARRKVEKAG
jgi:DNA-binding MarR family transcriptional regulator